MHLCCCLFPLVYYDTRVDIARVRLRPGTQIQRLLWLLATHHLSESLPALPVQALQVALVGCSCHGSHSQLLRVVERSQNAVAAVDDLALGSCSEVLLLLLVVEDVLLLGEVASCGVGHSRSVSQKLIACGFSRGSGGDASESSWIGL